ncbi:helix-hairpin-helix domain-containing protein [Pseudomonas citronellolis]|uniref:helix-hairpin-helix domain-containing protein n=1 Tax=Pseudomonas citronellolis TaxID=53408 RepID=UPI003899AFA6
MLLYSAAGQPLKLGKELGKGGEGSVYTIEGVNHLVAKVYHKPQDGAKQSKLRYMALQRDEQLLKYSAWPQDTLHAKVGGPVVGFVMAKVDGMTPIQTVYSPAHRKQEYPQRAWDFLVFVARNTAAAFTTLHQHGTVLGDVNHGNAYVGQNAAVTLIDTDSYQLSQGNLVHLCEVGVSHYTPPELQGGSFKGLTRTTNHDAFGLALLIFHLLFGGRHPYAGVPQKDGVGDTLEDNIKHLRFAYSRTASQRHLTPPPNSLPLSLVPPTLANMFEAAFTEEGRSGRRPTAKQWLDELDKLRNSLRKCSNSMHVFSNHLQACPWCTLEASGVVYFLSAAVFTAPAPGQAPVKIADIWLAITKVSAPADVAIPNPNQFKGKVKGRPLPAGVVGNPLRKFATCVIAAAAVGGFMTLQGPPLAYIIIAGLLTIGAWNYGTAEFNEERKARSDARGSALKLWSNALDTMKREADPQHFHQKRDALAKLKTEFDALGAREQHDIAALSQNIEKRQRQRYLEAFFIDRANLPGIGPAKRAALSSFGIETAADVEWNRIRRIKGFGEVLTRTLVDWKKSLDRQFKFNPKQAVTQNDINNVRRNIQNRAREIEEQLRKGLAELQQFQARQEHAVRRHMPIVQNAAQQLAQAEADLWEIG